jgi:3-hydroxy-D-aspartate aldolase
MNRNTVQEAPAAVGDAIEDVDTPALLVDLDAFEANLRTMAVRVAKAGLRLRPHAKTHKCAAVALRQITLGAVGVCCQKVSEAEALVKAGVPDVLVSNEVVDPRKLDRLARLATQARIGICVDSKEGIRALAKACGRNGAKVDVLIEINAGGDRCGVEPGQPALDLATEIASSERLRYAGIQAYHGRAQHTRAWTERRDAIAGASKAAARTRDLLAKNGITTGVVTGGGTGTHPFEMASGVYNELQAGSYVFMDADYGRNLDEKGEAKSDYRQSLFVYAQVMSLPGRRYAILDAGLKALAFDSGMPLVHGNEKLMYCRPSDEHGMLDLASADASFRIGDKVRLIPGHCDPTVGHYDWIVAYRGATVEEVWRVDARGALS